MVLKKYSILFTFSMSLLTTTALFAPPGHDEDPLKTTSTTPLKKSTVQESALPSEDDGLTPEECNRLYFDTDPDPTVLDIAFAKASETLTPVLEFLSDPKEVGHSIADAVIKSSPKAIALMHDASHSVADTVIKQSPKVVQALADASAAAATSVKSAVSTVLHLPSVARIKNAYDMYTLGKETGDGVAFVLPPERAREEDDYITVVDMNTPDAIPVASSIEKNKEKSS